MLFTDYTNYSVVYACSSAWLGMAIKEDVWVLSRSPTMSSTRLDEIRAQIRTKIPKYDHTANAEVTSHASCVYA